MAIEYVRDVIASGYNLSKINDNFAKIEQALQDALSRAGEGPNAMASDIDLNSNDLLNAGVIDTAELRIGGEVITPDALATIPPSVMLKSVYDPNGENTPPMYPPDYDPQGKGSDVYNSASHDFLPATGEDVRSVQVKLREHLSLIDFGAVGDGVTNDTVAINEAIASGFSVDGLGKTYLVDAIPSSVDNISNAGFKVGKIIHTTHDYWKGVTTSKISDSMLYTAWAQDKAYLIEDQIRVWGMEKESHTDGTERIVLFTSDDNGASFAPAEYLTPDAGARSVWSAGLWGNDEILIVRVGAGGLDVSPFTYEKWHRTFNFGAGTSDYNKGWTVTPITFPTPVGFTGQPSMVHSWTTDHENAIVVGAHYSQGAAVFRSTDGGVNWTGYIIASGTANEEPTVKYDPVTQRYYGFLRNGSAGGNPKWWHSVNINDLSEIDFYTAPTLTFGPEGFGMQASPIPFQIIDGRVHAFGSYRSGTFENTTDELTSAFYMDMPLTAGNIWAQADSKIYRLGTIAHREVGGASACGVGSVIVVDDKLHMFFGMEERTGTTNGWNRIANIYQTVIPLRKRTGMYDFRQTLADSRSNGPLKKLPNNRGYAIYLGDGSGDLPAVVGGRLNAATQNASVTISGGVLTLSTLRRYTCLLIDTEGAAATDDLDTITDTNANLGDILILRTNTSNRDVVIKHNTGNIQCGADRTLSNARDTIMLMYAGSSLGWLMLAFADNAA